MTAGYRNRTKVLRSCSRSKGCRAGPWAQGLSNLIPLTYFLQIVRGIVMKGLSIEYLWQFILPMLFLLGLLLALAVVRFGSKS